MRRRESSRLLIWLGVILLLSIAPVASAEDMDGDGIDDANDLCPGTPPGHAVDPNGCSDTDADGVYGYIDQCLNTLPGYAVDETGCYVYKTFYVEAIGGNFGWVAVYVGASTHDPSNPFVLTVAVKKLGASGEGAGGSLLRPLYYYYNPDTRVLAWIRAYEDGHCELWNQALIDTYDPGINGDYYDSNSLNPTEPCDIVTSGYGDPNYNGIYFIAYEAPDGDGDSVVDLIDLCPGTPPATPVNSDGCIDTDQDGVTDPNDECPATAPGAPVHRCGCEWPDDDNDGVYDYIDLDGNGSNDARDLCLDGENNDPVNADGCIDTDEDGITDSDDLCPGTAPSTLVNADGCDDADGDGVADTGDACPDTSPLGAQVCPDGCVDANDTDGDGVWECDDLCDDPCTYVTDTGCPDGDLDGIGDVDDFCKDTPAGGIVDPCGCHTKELFVRTDGPFWVWFKSSSGGTNYLDPYGPGDYIFENFPIGDVLAMTFGDRQPTGDLDMEVWARLHETGRCELWSWPELAYWNSLHDQPCGCPLSGSNAGIGGYDYDTICPHPTSTTYYIVESCPDCSVPADQDGWTVKAVWSIDTDGDGVQDPIDQCPDSDANLVIDQITGCEYIPVCDDQWHRSPQADVDGDCYVGPNDMVLMAEQWLDCVYPLGEGCMQLQLSPEDLYPNLMYMPQCWAKTVDGYLSDWTAASWVDLDLVYAGEPCDIVSAKYAVCWDPCNDKFYSAIVVEDACNYFETGPTNWDTSDRVEIYVQADPNGGDKWGSEQSAYFDKAQQYAVGYQNIVPGWTWAVFGNGSPIPDKYVPGNAEFDEAGRLNGSMIQYEIGAKAFLWYGGRTIPVGSLENVVRELEPGIHVGFDVVADSRWGAESYEFGMVSANLDVDKYIFAERFQRWELLDYDGSVVPPECGDWGYLSADINATPDCYVDLGDFTEMTIGWMDCTDPQPPCGYKSTQPF